MTSFCSGDGTKALPPPADKGVGVLAIVVVLLAMSASPESRNRQSTLCSHQSAGSDPLIVLRPGQCGNLGRMVGRRGSLPGAGRTGGPEFGARRRSGR